MSDSDRSEVLRLPNLPALEKVVLLIITDDYRHGDAPSTKQIAEWAGCSAFAVRGIIKTFEDQGVVTPEYGSVS